MKSLKVVVLLGKVYAWTLEKEMHSLYPYVEILTAPTRVTKGSFPSGDSPARRLSTGCVTSLFYRSKYDARKTLKAFSSKLRDETDLNALSEDLTSVVRETLQPAHVTLWLRLDTVPKGEQTVSLPEAH